MLSPLVLLSPELQWGTLYKEEMLLEKEKISSETQKLYINVYLHGELEKVSKHIYVVN